MTWAEICQVYQAVHPFSQPQSRCYIGVGEPRRRASPMSLADLITSSAVKAILVQGCVDRRPSFSFSYLPVLLLPYEMICQVYVSYGVPRLL